MARRAPWWSPVLLLVAVVLPAAALDLLPLTGLLMLVALWPVRTGQRGAPPVAA